MRRVQLMATVLVAATSASLTRAAPPGPTGWTLLLHGGAQSKTCNELTPEHRRGVEAGLSRALQAGAAVLKRGESSLDAVEAAVRVMEDDPHFNAGKGAAFTIAGTNELDAALMDGSTLAAGAVSGVMTTRNPISLARAVMEKTTHVMLAGPAADSFARKQGLEQVNPSYFRTPRQWKALQDAHSRSSAGILLDHAGERGMGTVGAVARDSSGRLAAATSTGGRTNKMEGRVGDAPVIGAGTYANLHCAVSGTGEGEYFIRLTIARDICARIELAGASIAEASDAVVGDLTSAGGRGGVIALDRNGAVAASFNSRGLARAVIDSSGWKRVELCNSNGFRSPAPKNR